MKKLKIHPSFLKILYLSIFLILLLIIIFTPFLVKNSISLTETFIVEEEIVEGFLVMILLSLSFLILNFYNNEVAKHKEQLKKINNDKKIIEERLNDAFSYIGKTNVQIQEIKSIFNKTNKYPETKNDFKKILHFLSERTLGIINVDWVLFRIINQNNQKTINEHLEIRTNCSLKNYPHISNKTIISKQSSPLFTSIISNPQNLNITVCCVLPNTKISEEQQILIQAIINQVTMLFIIFKFIFYKYKK